VFGYWRDAAKAYENAVRLKPDDVDSQFFLAASYKELGLAFDAIKVYHDIIKTKPEFAAAHFHLGIIYLKVGNLQEAREQYEILEQLDRHLSRKLKAEIKAAEVA
jgi:tetratricopeptide (TPR) repeat protein